MFFKEYRTVPKILFFVVEKVTHLNEHVPQEIAISTELILSKIIISIPPIYTLSNDYL